MAPKRRRTAHDQAAQGTSDADIHSGPPAKRQKTEISVGRITFEAKVRPRPKRHQASAGIYIVHLRFHIESTAKIRGKHIAAVSKGLRQDFSDARREQSVTGELDLVTGSISFNEAVESDKAILVCYLEEDNLEYFVASTPVKEGVKRRVHLLLGLHDRKIYVRKLVSSLGKPPGIALWPDHQLVPRLVSCVNLGLDLDSEEVDRGYNTWSIISEYRSGVTLERVNRYLGTLGNATIPHAVVWQFGAELLKFVQYLQLQEIPLAHNDLLPWNVVISQKEDEMPSFSVIDFGATSTVSHTNDDTTTGAGTEQFNDAEGVAVAMLEMMSLGVCYERGESPAALHDLFMSGRLGYHLGMYEIVKHFQQEAHIGNGVCDWSRQIRFFEDLAETRNIEDSAQGRSIGRLLPPPGHKLGLTAVPIEPLAFARKSMTTGKVLAEVTPKPFAIGFHQEVWIEPCTWKFTGELSESKWRVAAGCHAENLLER